MLLMAMASHTADMGRIQRIAEHIEEMRDLSNKMVARDEMKKEARRKAKLSEARGKEAREKAKKEAEARERRARERETKSEEEIRREEYEEEIRYMESRLLSDIEEDRKAQTRHA